MKHHQKLDCCSNAERDVWNSIGTYIFGCSKYRSQQCRCRPASVRRRRPMCLYQTCIILFPLGETIRMGRQ